MTYTEWLDKAMSLAEDYGYWVSTEYPAIAAAKDAARSALELPLRDVPMGEPVAMCGPGVTGQTVAWMSPVLCRWPADMKYPVPLYRHPKGSA